ncbi:MAG: TetR/AcrR family transcriptional regulator [Anaerolinea sp.]|nr:TetR/AcrR family transcriptional regulator [Anaerolinea sp.]MCC6972451.1 TetR/AcrR family transcriptional regulator [Anaerolineae bacterium]CAG1006736.1 HTH-type transcriptional repressor Bm3R1 [Anaerolineae bacterium]
MSDDLLVLGGRPTRADAAKNHALLLETAQKLFAEHGVEAVSMNMIAEAAGVGKGTLYRHFQSKADLCVALLDADQRELQGRALRRFSEPDSPYAKLCWFLEAVVAFVTRNNDLLDVDNPHLECSTLQHPAHLWWRQTISGLLQQMRPHQDNGFIADAVYVMLDVRTVRYLWRVRGYSMEQVVQGIEAIIERSVKP